MLPLLFYLITFTGQTLSFFLPLFISWQFPELNVVLFEYFHLLTSDNHPAFASQSRGALVLRHALLLSRCRTSMSAKRTHPRLQIQFSGGITTTMAFFPEGIYKRNCRFRGGGHFIYRLARTQTIAKIKASFVVCWTARDRRSATEVILVNLLPMKPPWSIFFLVALHVVDLFLWGQKEGTAKWQRKLYHFKMCHFIITLYSFKNYLLFSVACNVLSYY